MSFKRFQVWAEDVEELVKCAVDFRIITVDLEDLGIGKVKEEA